MSNTIKHTPIVVGDRFTTNCSGDCTVIAVEGNGTSRCSITVQFSATGFVRVVRASELRNGKARDPYYPNVFGVGYLGEGKYKGNNVADAYNAWYAMLQRVYSTKHYVGCSVAVEWHNFQVFADWYYKHYKLGYQLDKDILGTSKQYGPNTCMYVPRSINNAEAVLRHAIKDCPEMSKVLDVFVNTVKDFYLCDDK